MTQSFPRQYAATRRFSLGIPRAFNISPDGCRVTFLRSRSGTDPVNCLWVLDLDNGTERLAADPLALGAPDDDTPPEEKARRERAREQAAGIVSYACDHDLTVAVFALSGRVYVADLGGLGEQSVREVRVHNPALDPRPDPGGRRVAYVSGGALRVADLPGGVRRAAGTDGATGAGTEAAAGTTAAAGGDRLLAEPEHDKVTYGLPEFIAAEEMGRLRGYWWAPDGSAILAARVDESPVQRWYIADPANPGQRPTEVAYPAAGTANAEVTLVLVGLDGSHTPVDWDQVAYPYLATVCWDETGEDGPLFVVQDRSQRQMRILRADAATGRCELVHAASDDAWLDIVPGVPPGPPQVTWCGRGTPTVRAGCSSRRPPRSPALRLSPRPTFRCAGCSTWTVTLCFSQARRSRPRSTCGRTDPAGSASSPANPGYTAGAGPAARP